MRPDSGASHGKTKAGSVGFAGKKRLENMIGDSARDSRPVIGNREFQCTARVLTANFDDLAGSGDVNRIVNADH